MRDRYGGVYSGGEWTAFPLHPQDVPDAILGEDVSCRDYWTEYRVKGGIPAGVGGTPGEALEQLRAVPSAARQGWSQVG